MLVYLLFARVCLCLSVCLAVRVSVCLGLSVY